MLTQNLLSKERKMKLRWFVTLSTVPLLGVVTAFGLVPQSEFNIDTNKLAVESVVLPKVTPTTSSITSFWHSERVKRGDTVTDVLRRLGVADNAASSYLRTASAAESFRSLDGGSEVQAETDTNGNLVSLRYLDSSNAQVIIEKQGAEFTTRKLPAALEKRLFVRTGEVKTSLYAATDAAGLPEAAANQLIEIFNGDIDFHHDLKRGDKFTAVYEMTYSNGALVSTGRIQAAEFINQGQSYRAIYFNGDYYTPEGKSVRKAFLRSPIPFSRISSGFTTARFHPVLNKWRAHKGVDFAAPIGTAVRATSDGVVAFVGKQNGYGNVVMLSHQGRYTTVYGHLSRFAKGLRKGQRISQGEIIANVGMTGVTSGPHLHYEFKIDGVQRDPLRVAMPNAMPVSNSRKNEFDALADNFNSRLNLLRNTNLAKVD